MPFAYYGAKHSLAATYPFPAYRTIVEPFAGSAAYSVHYAAHVDRVVLVDADPALVDLWHRLQAMTADDVDEAVDRALASERTTEPLVAFIAGGTTIEAILAGKDRAVTPRMRSNADYVRRRVKAALPYVRTWEISNGTYRDVPEIEATYFVDPPYQSIYTMAGNGYRFSADAIDFDDLGEWCRTRPGQVIVCEQEPAAWLPFRPHRMQKNSMNNYRTEVVWTNSPDTLDLWENTCNS